MIKLTINNNPVEVENGTTILEAAKQVEIHIPTLCHLDLHEVKMVNQVGTCRVCMVEVEGRPALAPACSTPVAEGMVVHTDTLRAIRSRRMMVELLLSNHPKDCLVCERNNNCELQSLAAELGVREVRFEGKQNDFINDETSLSLVRNPNKCILCRRCQTMCNEVQTVGVYSAVNRGFDTTMGTAFNLNMSDTACTFCGQCVNVCPTGALTEADNTWDVWEALYDEDKYVIVQTAPAIRVALGEEFGMPAGSRVTGKMVAALRRMGFDKVTDTDWAADLTIMEEATELIHRIQHGGRLPILTSCCPAWVKFIEHQFPELLDVPSTCKSPHEMQGTIAKTYFAEKHNIDPSKIYVVSIMPCLAKKYEAARPELNENEISYVDAVLSTRELARMIREAGINFTELPDEDFDSALSESTGASVIFGTSGGVIEAALRTAYCWLNDGKKPDDIEFTPLRGLDGIRVATVQMTPDLKLNVAIANGLGSARYLLEQVRDGKEDYHAIEIMACPNGCIGGGGQPYHHNDINVLRKRIEAIYDEDRGKQVRYSHENEEVQRLYDEFLGEPYSEKAHKLLHTEYVKRELI